MPALHIRNVPDETVVALKERAQRHGRSLEAELREILGEAAAMGGPHLDVVFTDRLIMSASGSAESFSRGDIYGDEDPDGR